MAKNDNIKRLIEGLEADDEARLEREFNDLYGNEPRQFSEGFADRVVALTADPRQEHGVEYFLPRLFRWVAIAGVAAAAALLISTYIAEDDLSMDALAGINQVTIEEVASLNF